jgi:protein-tyrosine phosphatase
MPMVNWIELEGSVNVRDVGGLPTSDGHRIRRGVLLRSANLQYLTAADIRALRDGFDIRKVIDLRTDVEVSTEGRGPLHAEPDVVIHHLSLYPDRPSASGRPDLDPAASGEANVGLLSHSEVGTQPAGEPAGSTGTERAAQHYLRYLAVRPDSILAAFRAAAEPVGTIVRCAAGKDRTGVVIALILSALGVTPELVAADYAATELRVSEIAAHLRRSSSELYSSQLLRADKVPAPSAEVMLAVLDAIEHDHGGTTMWLAEQGWTSTDHQRLRAALLEPADDILG